MKLLLLLALSICFADGKREAGKVPAAPVAVVMDATGDAGYIQTLSKCSNFKEGTKSCFSEYDGAMRGQCEVCREKKSCFMSLDGKASALCEAYLEKKPCFVTLHNEVDRGWCARLQEKKSCKDAFFGIGLESEKARCDRGDIPRDHYFWIN